MALADRIVAFLEDKERLAKSLRVAYWISLGFLLFGYGVIFYLFFF